MILSQKIIFIAYLLLFLLLKVSINFGPEKVINYDSTNGLLDFDESQITSSQNDKLHIDLRRSPFEMSHLLIEKNADINITDDEKNVEEKKQSEI